MCSGYLALFLCDIQFIQTLSKCSSLFFVGFLIGFPWVVQIAYRFSLVFLRHASLEFFHIMCFSWVFLGFIKFHIGFQEAFCLGLRSDLIRFLSVVVHAAYAFDGSLQVFRPFST